MGKTMEEKFVKQVIFKSAVKLRKAAGGVIDGESEDRDCDEVMR